MKIQTLERVITRAALGRLAGGDVFGRGEEYFSADTVGGLRVRGDRVSADVIGRGIYGVELRIDGGQLVADCSCPHAEDGNFCKHCVAVGLAWLAVHSRAQKSAAAPLKRKRFVGGAI